jgi:hypothetical protein
MPISDWSERATATNAAATATHAANADLAHHITAAYARFSDTSVAGTLTLKVGSATVWDQPFTGSLHIEFPHAIRGDENAAVSADIGAGGLAVDGFVGIFGYSV